MEIYIRTYAKRYNEIWKKLKLKFNKKLKNNV